MRNVVLTPIFFLFLSMLGGCAPIPHYATVSPAVIGTVHRNGIPVENATIYMEHPKNGECAFGGDVISRSDSAGNFQFTLREEFRFFATMDVVGNWQVCIVDGENRYQGWYEYGIGNPPLEIRLDCNLESKPHSRKTAYSLHTKGICTSNINY